MILWWIFDIVILVVIVPVVVLLLTRMLQPALEVKRGADELAASGDSLVAHLGGVEQLQRTRELVREVAVELEGYGQALDGLR